MGLARQYPHGTFCWIELGTPDLAAAKVFYTRLFDWTYEDVPAGGEPYTIAKRDGVDVGGLDGHRPEEGYGWQSYLAVHDLPSVLDKARELGATVLPHAGDLPVASRFAILRDPTGAEVTLWENEGGYHGARLVNEVGTWSWNELVTPDLLTIAPTEVFSDTVPAGLIIDQNPASGASGLRGDTIKVTVSKGPELIPLPSTFGKNIKDAKPLLESAGFKVDVQYPKGISPFNLVYDQNPGGGDGKTAPRGATVTLSVF